MECKCGTCAVRFERSGRSVAWKQPQFIYSRGAHTPESHSMQAYFARPSMRFSCMTRHAAIVMVHTSSTFSATWICHKQSHSCFREKSPSSTPIQPLGNG